jgi:hypothetical protein
VLKRSRALISTKRKMTGTAVYGTVRTVVWEDGGGNPSSYPISLHGSSLFISSHLY